VRSMRSSRSDTRDLRTPLYPAQLVAFYEAAAQVILVLIVVVAIEARIFGTTSNWKIAVIYGALFGVLVWGEIYALRALQTGRDSAATSALVWAAIGLGLFLITVRAAPGRWRR
jgi:TRAP-type C4-dicarboxylate transport system permease large subunit